MSSQPNQSLIDGIRCFQELAVSDAPMGNRELADRLGINVVKANRLLMTLKSIGLAEQGANKKYRPGPAVHLLAAQSFHSSQLFNKAVGTLGRQKYDDRIVALGVLWKDSVMYMYHAEPGQDAIDGLGGYHLYHASQSSIGQLLLADLENEEVMLRLEHCDEAFRHEILINQASIREQGYCALFDEKKQSYNIAMKVCVDGASAGIAFSDLEITEDQVPVYVDELHKLIQLIQQN